MFLHRDDANPIEKADANAQETFGGYVSIYDIEDAKKDKATVPIYYESRLAKLDINREPASSIGYPSPLPLCRDELPSQRIG